MLQTFTLKDIAQLTDWESSNDLRFEYVTSLRVFSGVAHGAKEPFSLRAFDSQPPILDDELDAEAEKRALMVLWLNHIFPKDTKGVTAKDVISKEIFVNGQHYNMTPDFAARCVWWIAVYLAGARSYPPEWYDQLRAYLQNRWPQFNTRPLTEDVVCEWLIWRDKQIEEATQPTSWILGKLIELKKKVDRLSFTLKFVWANIRYRRRRYK